MMTINDHELIAYRRFETGFTVYEYFMNREMVCSIIEPVMPVNADIPILYSINLIKKKQNWTCEINRQDTLFQDKVRIVADKKTGAERCRLVFQPYEKRWDNQAEWILVCDDGKKRIEVKEENDGYVFYCGTERLLLIRRIDESNRHTDCDGTPLFRVLCDSKMEEEWIMAMLIYPVLSRC